MKTPRPNLIAAWRAVLLSTALACLAGRAQGADATKSAYDYLAGILVDKKNSAMAIRSLHAADDQELTPLFVAMARSSNKTNRLLATTALGQLAGPEAIAAMKRQLAEDSTMAVRASALVHLLNLKAADPAVLSAAVKVRDENVQCIAARSLANCSKEQKHRDLAQTTLKKLTESSDKMTAAMAQLGLLAMRDSAQLPGLKRIVSDPDTEAAVVRLMMLQIADEKISSARPLVRIVIDSPKCPVQTRIIACRALAEIDPKSAPVIFASLRKSQSMVYRIRTLGIIARQDDAQPYLTAIAKSSLTVGPLAGFEQARATPGPASSIALDKALAIRHPIAVSYILQQAKKDIDKLGDKAGFYVAPLLKYIASVEPDADNMTREHLLAAQATTLLMDLGTPEAVGGVGKILNGRYSAITRSVAAGLLQTKNKAVRPIALKLLKNPYPELATYGALTLGHFADPAAAGHFKRIITRESGHRVAEVTLASWYLLKIRKQSASAAKQLAKLVK